MRVEFIALLATAWLAAAPALAQPETTTPAQGVPDLQPIYGRELMTGEEIARHRERMRAAGSAEERARIRTEHHAKMRRRAAERGIELPEAPPAGRGPGSGQGRHRGGKGPGGGAGPGGGRP